jgi:hypothetical protein
MSISIILTGSENKQANITRASILCKEIDNFCCIRTEKCSHVFNTRPDVFFQYTYMQNIVSRFNSWFPYQYFCEKESEINFSRNCSRGMEDAQNSKSKSFMCVSTLIFGLHINFCPLIMSCKAQLLAPLCTLMFNNICMLYDLTARRT